MVIPNFLKYDIANVRACTNVLYDFRPRAADPSTDFAPRPYNNKQAMRAIDSLRYVETEHGYRLDIGRFRFSQSTFLLLAAILVGIGGGYGAVAFRYLIEGEEDLAFGHFAPALHALGPAQVVPVLIVGGVLTAFIVNRFAKEAKGHGVPEVMASVALQGGVMRPRVIAVKSLASATCIGFGGSCGREGPIVQIGSTIGSVLGQIVRAPAQIIRTLVACGAAAGISATFNAPIGGVFFASEVILGDFAPRSFATIVVSSVVAAVIGRAHFGNHPSFTASAFYLVSPAELGLYAILGVIAAFWAAGFVRTCSTSSKTASRRRNSVRCSKPPSVSAPSASSGFGFRKSSVSVTTTWMRCWHRTCRAAIRWCSRYSSR